MKKMIYFAAVAAFATVTVNTADAQTYVPDSSDVKEIWAEELRSHVQNIAYEEHATKSYKDPYCWVDAQYVGNNPAPVPVRKLKTHGFEAGVIGDYSTVGNSISGGAYGGWRGRHLAGQMVITVGQGEQDKSSAEAGKKFIQQTIRLQGEVKLLDTSDHTFNVWGTAAIGLKRYKEKSEQSLQNEAGELGLEKKFSGYAEQARIGLKLRYTPKWSIAEFSLSAGGSFDRGYEKVDMKDQFGGYVNLSVGVRFCRVHKSSLIK